MTVLLIYSLSLSLSLSRKLLGILCKQWFNFVEVIFYVIRTVWTVKEKIVKEKCANSFLPEWVTGSLQCDFIFPLLLRM